MAIKDDSYPDLAVLCVQVIDGNADRSMRLVGVWQVDRLNSVINQHGAGLFQAPADWGTAVQSLLAWAGVSVLQCSRFTTASPRNEMQRVCEVPMSGRLSTMR